MEPFPVLDGLIIPNSRSLVKRFFRVRLFSVNESETKLATYPTLDEHIILELEPIVKNFLDSFLFSFQCEWIRLVTNLILYEPIIP